MTSSISSTEVLATTATAYAWLGTPGASASRQSVNGVETRRNLAQRANAVSGWSGWFGAGGAGTLTYAAVGGPGESATFARVTMTASATGQLVGPYVGGIPVEQAKTYTVSASARTSRADGAWRLGVLFTNSSGATIGSEVAPGGLITSPSDAWVRLAATLVAPAGATMMRITVWRNVVPAAGDTYDAAALLVEESSTAGSYFDGSTAGATVTTFAMSRPLQVIGYESQRASANVFHDVIGRATPDVTLRPAGLRKGTLSYLFDTETAAAECERMHAGTAVLTLEDPELPTIAMSYVADGAITRQLDAQSRALWLVNVAYREVRP